MYARSCESSTDYITIRDGIDEESSVIATYCSSVSDASVTSSAETLTIELVTDEKKQRQGFAAEFAFIASDAATADDRPSPLQPPSSGLVVDGTTTAQELQTARQQYGGTCRSAGLSKTTNIPGGPDKKRRKFNAPSFCHSE